MSQGEALILGKRVLTRIDRKIKGDGSEAKLPVFKNRTKESIDRILKWVLNSERYLEIFKISILNNV